MKIFICLLLLTACSLKPNSEGHWHGCHGAFGIAYLESMEEAEREKG